jgi:hypothetical protein
LKKNYPELYTLAVDRVNQLFEEEKNQLKEGEFIVTE